MKNVVSRIETERLILREWTLDDVNDQVEGLSNFSTAKNLLVPFPYTSQNSIEYISQHLKNIPNNFAFAVELKENGKVIGGTNLYVSGEENRGGIWINEKAMEQNYGQHVQNLHLKFCS